MTTDSKLDEYEASQPSTFRFIERIYVSRNFDDTGELRLEVTLAKRPEPLTSRLSVLFHGIRDLHIQNLEFMVGVMLVVRSIRADGLEDLNYRVVDDENNILRFLCRDFEILVTDQTALGNARA
jgi:hypothetical protein